MDTGSKKGTLLWKNSYRSPHTLVGCGTDVLKDTHENDPVKFFDDFLKSPFRINLKNPCPPADAQLILFKKLLLRFSKHYGPLL